MDTTDMVKGSRYIRVKQLGWLVAIWAASVAALAVVAWVLRGVMAMVGMTR